MVNRREFLAVTSAGLISLAFGCSDDERIKKEVQSIKDYPKLDPSLQYGDVVRFIEDNREENIDYSNLWPQSQKVISFGENHSIKEDERDIIEHLGLYKNQGATHLVFELPRERFQVSVDEFYEGKIGEEELRKLERDYTWSKNEGNSNLIVAAKKLGLISVCADTKNTEKSKHNGTFGASIWDDLDSRNQHHAKIIRGVLRDGNTRVIAHGGAGHWGHVPVYNIENEFGISAKNISGYLDDMGIGTFRVTYAGGKGFLVEPETEPIYIGEEPLGGFPRVVGIAARKLGIEKEKFGIRLNENAMKQNWGNYLIHLPQE